MIRKAKQQDIEAMQLIGKVAYVQGYESILGKDLAQQIADEKYSIETLSDLINDMNHYIYVFTINVIKGFAIIKKEGSVIHIQDLYVFPSKQRMGIGREFVEYFSNRFTSVNELTITIENGNTTAVKFLEELGFEQLSCSPSLIENVPVKLIHMHKVTR